MTCSGPLPNGYCWTWAGQVRSYWAGTGRGWFAARNPTCIEQFAAWQRVDVAGACGQRSDEIFLDPQP